MVTGEKVFFFCLCYHNKQTLRDGVYILNFDDSTKRAHDTNTTLKCIINYCLVIRLLCTKAVGATSSKGVSLL